MRTPETYKSQQASDQSEHLQFNNSKRCPKDANPHCQCCFLSTASQARGFGLVFDPVLKSMLSETEDDGGNSFDIVTLIGSLHGDAGLELVA